MRIQPIDLYACRNTQMGIEMNIITIIVLIILILCTLAGMKAGLVKTVFSMFSFIAALILTVCLSPLVSNVLQKNEKVTDYFNNKVEAALDLENVTVKAVDQISFIEDLPLPDSIKNSLLEHNTLDIYEKLNVNSFTEYITHVITNMIINSTAFIGTFLVLIIILQILCFVLNIVSKLPVLNSVNKAGGLIAGLLHGLIIIWILCIFITASGSTSFGRSALASINESDILSYIYDNNLIAKYITVLKIK